MVQDCRISSVFQALTGVELALNSVDRSPLSMAASGLRRVPDAMIMAVPAALAILPASSLVFMPPREYSDAAAPAIASISGVIASTTGRNCASRILMRRGGIEPINIGKQDQEVRAHHGRDPCSKPVIVAIADFGGGNRVIFIDDRNRLQPQQGPYRCARIEIAAALFRIGKGQQDLSGAQFVVAQNFRIGLGQFDLAGGSCSLAFLKPQCALWQAQHRPAKRDRAGRYDHHLDARCAKRCNVGAKAFKPITLQAAGTINKQSRADLDNDPAIDCQLRQRNCFASSSLSRSLDGFHGHCITRYITITQYLKRVSTSTGASDSRDSRMIADSARSTCSTPSPADG